MDIKKYIDEYTSWLKSEITFSKVGEYYEITTPFLDDSNDYLQLYVKQNGDEIYFTDDGYTLNRLEDNGIDLSSARRKQIIYQAQQYGVNLFENELVMKAQANSFPQHKHLYIQCLLKISDMFTLVKGRTVSTFSDQIQSYFSGHDIYYSENIQFTGKSGFTHTYDYMFQRSKNKPERLCVALNNPNKQTTSAAIFTWDDTKPTRRADSKLIALLNDSNKMGKGVEDALSNYGITIIRWSERDEPRNINLLSA